MNDHEISVLKDYMLSVVIPARNEEWISNTVADLLKNSTAKTEIIVVLDGAWAEPGIVDHPDVKIVYLSKSIGQRAATNLGVKLSKAKWVVKCDAHCSFDMGWDTKMLAAGEGHEGWTMVPIMRNLHVFSWKCMKCGKKTYQGPTPGTRNGISKCEDCGNVDYTTFKKRVEWYAKPSPQSTSYCFDSEPHFQYFKEFAKRPEGQGDITPTMSLQGSFFMCTRERYWALNLGDESFGSWGSQGLQVACSTWLTGGQVMCIRTTWYSHCFRTQGGDFSFPYQQHQSKVEEAKERARQLFFRSKVPNQVHPLSWLIEKFAPVPGWTDADLAKLKEEENAH
jgi:glycosyltransferase involved in cell wall biosynthesis